MPWLVMKKHSFYCLENVIKIWCRINFSGLILKFRAKTLYVSQAIGKTEGHSMDVYSSLRFYRLVKKEKLIICVVYSLK